MMEWIDCEERLPLDQETVLAWDGKDIYIFKFIETKDRRFKKRRGYFEFSSDEYWPDKITFWMELPRPPEKI